MTTRTCYAFAVMAALAAAPTVLGHGTPADVTAVGGQLTITGNAPTTPGGFTDQLFAETITGSALIPVSQDRLFTDFPGVDITGISVGSGLWIEPLMLDADPGPGVSPRGVWWWSPISEEVEPLDEEFRIDLISARGFGVTSLAPDEAIAEPLEIMEPLASDLNNHRHPLYYVVPNGSVAPTGAFAFFAKLTSPTYDSSEPFLIGLNHGLGATQFVEAVQAINEAAGSVPGFYDPDPDGDVADLMAWQRTDGTTQSLTSWETYFGEGASPIAAAIGVPEPCSVVLMLVGTLCFRSRR
ncbi:MAG: hypothetical protein AAGA92_02380 [Planctomycetota bacterium]